MPLYCSQLMATFSETPSGRGLGGLNLQQTDRFPLKFEKFVTDLRVSIQIQMSVNFFTHKHLRNTRLLLNGGNVQYVISSSISHSVKCGLLDSV